MAKKIQLLIGLSAIDTAIRDAKGIRDNFLERAQQLALSVINHDIEHGDCSRATQVVNLLPNAEQRRFMVQFLAYYGGIGIKVEKGYAVASNHIASDSKRFRKPDLAGAREHLWHEPYDASGKKAPSR